MSILHLLAQLTIDRSEIGYNTGIVSDIDPLSRILDLVYLGAGIVVIIVIIMAGYLFVTSRGDPAEMKRSKDALRGAVIGLVVIIAAFAITRFVLGGLQ